MLIARNLTINDVILPVIGKTIPASSVGGVRGAPVNVTSELKPDLTIDPTIGRSGGVDGDTFDLLQAQVLSLTVCYEWTGIPEYKTGNLQVFIPNQLSRFLVGKDPGDPYSSILDAVTAANSVATSTEGAVVYVKPGVYTELDPIVLDGSVTVQSIIPYEDYPKEDGMLAVVLNGSFSVTGSVGESGKIKGFQINSTGATPVFSINTSGYFYISDCFIKEHTSSTTLIDVQGGSVYIVSSNIVSSGAVSAISSSGDLSLRSSKVGIDPSSPLVINSIVGYFHITCSTIYGGITADGVSSSIWGNTHFILDGTTLSVGVGKNLYLYGVSMSQMDPSITQSMISYGSASSRLTGCLSAGEFNNAPLSNIYLNTPSYAVFVDKLNCDSNLLIKSDPGSVNLDTQHKHCIINKLVAEATDVYLPISPLLGEEHTVVDGLGDANINNILVRGNGNNINGIPDYVLSVARGKVRVVYNGLEWTVL